MSCKRSNFQKRKVTDLQLSAGTVIQGVAAAPAATATSQQQQ
jgi:hypothetical protein